MTLWGGFNICLFLFSAGKNVVHQLGVTLEEMYNGSTRKLGLQKNVICEKCDGKSLRMYLIKRNTIHQGQKMSFNLSVFNPRLWWKKGCLGEVLHLQRKRRTNQSPTTRTRHDSADPVYVFWLPGTGGKIQLQGPLQELQRTQSGTQEENPRGSHRQRLDTFTLDIQTGWFIIVCVENSKQMFFFRYERWPENYVPWRRWPGTRTGAWRRCNRPGSEGTSRFPETRQRPDHEDGHQACRGLVWFQ